MGSNDPPPYAPSAPDGKPVPSPRVGALRGAAGPAAARGAYSGCGPGSSCGGEDGSGDVGSGESGGGGGGGGGESGGGSGAADVCAGGGASVGAGPPGPGGLPWSPGTGADALPAADGEAGADGGSLSFSFFPCSRPPPPAPPARPAPPCTAPAPPGAPPSCCLAEGDGRALPPASPPTLTQPVATARAVTAVARRTDTDKGRTGSHLREERRHRAQRPSPTRGHAIGPDGPQPYPRACRRSSSIPKWWAISCTTVISVSAITSSRVSHIRSVGPR